MRCSVMGDHVLFTDQEGGKWMTVSSFQSFTDACGMLHAERSLTLGTVLWVVVMPELPLEDASELKNMILSTEMLRDSKGKKLSDNKSAGWCRGVPFLVRNMSLLDSKAEEHGNFSGLSDQIMNMSTVLRDNLSAIRNNAKYKDSISDFYLQQQNELCLQYKEHLVLSLYWREICDDSDVHERFGPHTVIHKLLPELHNAIYGHGKHDPCNPSRYNSDAEMLRTEESLKEEMYNLMVKNQGYKKTVSVDKQALSFVHAKGEQEKLLKLAEVVKRFDLSLQIFQAELDSICLDLDRLCVKPTLVGNLEAVPDWVVAEDLEEADFEEEENLALYPEGSRDD